MVKSDTGTRTVELYSGLQLELSGNVSNTNTRFLSRNSELIVGGAGNIVATSPVVAQAGNDTLTVGSSFGGSNTTVATGSVTGHSLEVVTGSTVTNALLNRPTVFGGGVKTNVYGYTPWLIGAIGNFSLIHMQNASGNGWGVSVLPTTFRFLDNQDTRSSSRVGPIESYFDRPFAFTSTSGSVELDFANGTSQTLKPTDAVTLSFANAVTSSNGNLLHTVTLLIEQDSTGYAVTLPAASSTVKYAGGNNSVGSTADSVTMVVITAAVINSVTTYLVTVSPEFV
jgi:hypothetical protein